MFRTTAGLGLAAALAAGSACAGDKLQFGPAPAWVKPMLIGTTPARDASLDSYTVLSRSIQMHFTNDGDSTFTETAIRVQDVEGFDAGQPTTVWDPVTEDMMINRAYIVRNGKVIDLLGQGQTFTVLQRETGLKRAVLDGSLTAVMQLDGLQVGDIVDFATTVTRRNPVLGGRSEDMWVGLSGRYTGSAQVRVIWPNAKPMHWRASEDLPVPTLLKGADETELTLTLDGYRWPALATDAPARFNNYGVLQFSQFNSWTEVSALMGPYYDRAATLGPNSPLRAEVEQIRAASSDPKVQAAAALKLVEDNVRYLSNDAKTGGFIPPSADASWLRRWGDCKAKSVLMVALLRQLGIKADPILVNTQESDVMNTRIPALALFDHVIVRAVIAGKTYWLDATGYGDGALDNLVAPPYEWFLPMVSGGEDLQPLPQPPFEQPENEIRLRIDASAGIDAPAPAHAEVIERYNMAVQTRLAWQTQLPEDLDKQLRDYWTKQYRWIKIESVSLAFDPAAGELRFIMDGTARLPWLPARNGHGARYMPNNSDIDDYFTMAKRDKGPHDQAPVALDYPAYDRVAVTIALPDKGAGFSVSGDMPDVTLAGAEITHRVSLKDGIFSVESGRRTMVPDVPLAEAKAGRDALDTINEAEVYLEAPLNAPAPKSGAAVASGSPAAGETSDEVAAPEPVVRQSSHPLPEPGTAALSLHDVAEIYAGRKLP